MCDGPLETDFTQSDKFAGMLAANALSGGHR